MSDFDSLLFEYIQDDEKKCVWLPRRYGMFWAQMRHHYMNKFVEISLGKNYKVLNTTPGSWDNMISKDFKVRTIHRSAIKEMIGED